MILAYDTFQAGPANMDNNVPWTSQVGSADWKINNQHFGIPSTLGSVCAAVFSQVTWPNNHYAKAKIASLVGRVAAGVRGGGVGVRMDSASINGYYVVCNITTGAIDTQIIKQTPAQVVLSTSKNNWLPGDTVYLEVIGTTLVVKKNGVQVATTTDSDIASGSAGVYYTSTIGDYSLSSWEGGDFTDQPTYSQMVLASDNFNRTDASTLGSNWSDSGGVYNQPTIINQEAVFNWSLGVAGRLGARYTGIQWPNNQFSQIQLTGTLPIGADDDAGVAVRMSTVGDQTFYSFRLSGGNGHFEKRIAGVTTNLYLFPSSFTGVLLNLQITGSTITLKRNGVTILVTQDTSILSGQAGIFSLGSSGKIAFADNWQGGGEMLFSFPQSINILRSNRILSY